MVGDTAVFHVVALVARAWRRHGAVVCQFILCARHFVLALRLCLLICLAALILS